MSTHPTTTANLLQAIREVLEDGSGSDTSNSKYTIDQGTFTLNFWYEGREETSLTVHSLSKPQVKITINSMSDSQAWPKFSDQTMYDLVVSIHVAYYTDSKLLKTRQEAIKTQVLNDTHKISKALQRPGNLRQTSDNNPTGLVGGLLQSDTGLSELEWDPDNSILSGVIGFSGKVVLDNST